MSRRYQSVSEAIKQRIGVEIITEDFYQIQKQFIFFFLSVNIFRKNA